MDGEHERYEALAVGHVLGGLDEVAAADFRAHLLECRPCRQRVAELRDLADDLEVAAREERAQLQLKTEVRSEEDSDEDGGSSGGGFPWDIRQWTTALAAAVALGIVLGLLAWNMTLSHRLGEVLDTTQVREQVLAELADGSTVPTDFQAGTQGRVVVDSQDIAASLAGIPRLETGQAVVVWTGGDTLTRQEIYAPSEIVDGRLAYTIPDGSATRMVVSIESVPIAEAPEGQRLVESRLRPGGAGGTDQGSGQGSSEGSGEGSLGPAPDSPPGDSQPRARAGAPRLLSAE